MRVAHDDQLFSGTGRRPVLAMGWQTGNVWMSLDDVDKHIVQRHFQMIALLVTSEAGFPWTYDNEVSLDCIV